MKKRTMLNRIFAIVMAGAMSLGGCMPVLAGGENRQELDAQESKINTAAVFGERATQNDVLEPTPDNKKGIQGYEWQTATDEEFQASLNHVFFPVDLGELFDVSGGALDYEYNGKTYSFNNSLIGGYKTRIQSYRESGKAVTFQLQMYWPKNHPELQSLIYPEGRQDGYICYALNIEDPQSKETISAAFHFLMDVFGTSEHFVQNWILGNEINLDLYNHTGVKDPYINIRNYALTYDLLYQAQQDNNPCGKTYICLTNLWNYQSPDIVATTKEYLDTFASMERGKAWNLAFHAYPENMVEAMWSKDAAEAVVDDPNTSVITAANLHVLTDYIKENYGSSHRVILSEQGFDAQFCGQQAQAASIAYLYKAAANNDMIDAMIYVNLKDYGANSGWADTQKYMGLMDEHGNKREAYTVFTYMNTPQSSQYVDKYMQYITPNDAGTPIHSWTDSIIWKAASTTAAINNGAGCYAEAQNGGASIWMGMSSVSATADVPLEYRWLALPAGSQTWIEVTPWRVCSNPTTTNYSFSWYPEKRGTYVIVGEVRVAGNPSSVTQTNSFSVSLPSELPFVDISGGEWFYPAVKALFSKKIMTGMTEKIFGPNEDLARAQFAAILYRMAGSPEVKYKDTFSDIADNVWYTKAVIWASEAGVVTGYADGRFGPADPINREQMAVMMYRYAENVMGYDVSKLNDLSAFPDKGNVTGYALEGMGWAVESGLISGTNGRLDPQGSAVRAQTATIIHRFIVNNKL